MFAVKSKHETQCSKLIPTFSIKNKNTYVYIYFTYYFFSFLGKFPMINSAKKIYFRCLTRHKQIASKIHIPPRMMYCNMSWLRSQINKYCRVHVLILLLCSIYLRIMIMPKKRDYLTCEKRIVYLLNPNTNSENNISIITRFKHSSSRLQDQRG